MQPPPIPQAGAAPPRLPRWEVADILRTYGAAYLRQYPVSATQRKAIDAILACRTAVLGGHVELCDTCDYQRIAYNSCRNRHCPKCQALAQARWLARRQEYLLPVSHFHVVFTLPAELRPLLLRNPRLLYGLLFSTATQTLLDFGRDPKHLGAQLGITAVLHTWSRTLAYHPHLHCIVTGGGLSLDQERWVPTHQRGRFLFPVKALAKVFRARFLCAVRQLYQRKALNLSGPCTPWQQGPAFDALLQALYMQDWHVYAKRPFGGAEQVYAYLGRYTHRVGLSNHRLRDVSDQGVRFATKQGQQCTLTPLEFLRRFLLHVLPTGFVKIRHYGLFAGSNVKTKLVRAQRLLTPPRATPSPAVEALPLAQPSLSPAAQAEALHPGLVAEVLRLTGQDLTRCPQCRQGLLRRVSIGAPVQRRSSGALVSRPLSAGTMTDSS